MKSAKKLVSKILLSTCAITTLAITPFINIDPFAPPKMAILGAASSALLILLLFSNELIFKVKTNYIFLLLILDLLLVYYFSGANKVEQFYGTVGRNFGLLTQLSLVVICVTSANYYSLEITKNFKKLIIIVGGINMAYGTIQLMGEDFVSNWTTTYENSARGFFGNPNIGSVVLYSLEDSPEFSTLQKKFQPGDRFFFVSSIFGGTGAAGYPTILQLLNNKVNT